MIVTEQHAILTEHWPDFHNEMRQASAAGTTHYGVLFTSPRSLPRSRGTIGRYVDVLDSFLKRHEAPDALLWAAFPRGVQARLERAAAGSVDPPTAARRLRRGPAASLPQQRPTD